MNLSQCNHTMEVICDDIVSQILQWSPNRTLRNFLLVSKRTRQRAFAECKKRSTLSHLWDVPRETLMKTLCHKKGELFLYTIHRDVNLCAVLGVVEPDAVEQIYSEDLITLAIKMGLHAGKHKLRWAILAAEYGHAYAFSEIYDKLQCSKLQIELRHAMTYSMSAEIRAKSTVPIQAAWSSLYTALQSKDPNTMKNYRLRGSGSITQACERALSRYLSVESRPEVEKRLVEFYPGLKSHLDTIRAHNRELFSREVWSEEDIKTNPYTLGRQKVICVDDPKLLSFDCRQTPIIGWVQWSCCPKMAEFVGGSLPDVPPLTSSSEVLKMQSEPYLRSRYQVRLNNTDSKFLDVWMNIDRATHNVIAEYHNDGRKIVSEFCKVQLTYYNNLLDAVSSPHRKQIKA